MSASTKGENAVRKNENASLQLRVHVVFDLFSESRSLDELQKTEREIWGIEPAIAARARQDRARSGTRCPFGGWYSRHGLFK